MEAQQSGGDVLGTPERLQDSSIVAVLDAGVQYVDLVQKATERLGYPSDVLPLGTPAEYLRNNYSAIIISGSPASSHNEDAPLPDPRLWEENIPVLGICYGMQAMAQAYGGRVAKNGVREDGRVTTEISVEHALFRGIRKSFTGLFTHGDFVVESPLGFEVIGSHELTDGTKAFSAIAKGNKVGVQFHPEVFDDTPQGYELFKNFFVNIAELEPDETFLHERLTSQIEQKRAEIRKKANGRQIVAFMSGGVDSSVAGTLAQPDHAFYIDNGYMRDEDEGIIEYLATIGLNVEKIDAAEKFAEATVTIDGITYGPLKDVSDPQIKRRLIGKTFVDVQNDLVARLGLRADEAVLLQGTNAADRIESGYSKGDSHTAVIKTHHNLVPEARDLDPIEPLDDLFKDEIRALGYALGLPTDVLERQPFPGPGLAIRILHAKSDEYEIPATEKGTEIQALLKNTPFDARLLPVRSVGVGGDERSHLSAVALAGPDDWDNLAWLATELPGRFKGSINRVIYALTDESLGNLSVTPTDASQQVIDTLKHADRIVFEEMRAFELIQHIKQCPVVLLPLSFGKPGERSIVLRPVTTSTFMTVQAMLPKRDLPESFIWQSASRIAREVPGVSQVFLDLTNKPPATTEWE